MFERMEIPNYICGGVVEPSYKKPTREDANRAGYSRKTRGESASLNTYSNMSESAIKCIKRYVENLKDRSKLICFVHGPGNSWET